MKSISFAALAAVAALTVAAQPAAELKLDDVIKKSIEAQGGLEKMKAIKSMKLTGKMILGGVKWKRP